jgi:hypothetical protein
VPPYWLSRYEPPRPAAMDRAMALMCVGAAVSAISAVVSPLLIDLSDSWSFGLYSSPDQQDAAAIAGYVGAIFTLPMTVGLWLWLAWANGKGKSWARTVVTVLAVMQVALFVPGVVLTTTVGAFGAYRSSAALAAGLIIRTIGIGVGVWAVWLMYRPESNAFYDASGAPRFLPPYQPYPAYSPPGSGGWPGQKPAATENR